MKKHKAKKHSKKNKGFSLIELLIVVAIILIIAAIAIPNLLRSRIAANEASAVGSTRTIVTAEITYGTTYPAYGYAANLGALGPASAADACATPTAANACLIDFSLASAISPTQLKSGYSFAANPVPAGSGVLGTQATDFVAGADPGSIGTTGVRAFCASTDGVVRYLSPATSTTAFPTDVASCTTVYTAL